MSKFKIFLAILPLLCSCSLYSQNDTPFILPQLEIIRVIDNRFIVYDFKRFDKNRFYLNDSSLSHSTGLINFKLKISEIQKISIRNGAHFWTGAAIAGAAGFALGFYALRAGIRENPDEHFDLRFAFIGGIIFGVPSGLIGGLIGALFPEYNDHNIKDIRNEYKHQYLKNVLLKYRVNGS